MKGALRDRGVTAEMNNGWGILENTILDCVARNRQLCSDRLLELLPVVADEMRVYDAVERLQRAGLLDAQLSKEPDAPRFVHISLSEQGRMVLGR